jgi:CRP-like cAMP-binding protein
VPISRVELRKFSQSTPNLVRLLLEFTARQLELTQDQLLLISKGTATEKVAIGG